MSESESTPQPSREARSRDNRVKPLYLVLGAIGALAVVVVGIVLFTGKDHTPGAPGGGDTNITATQGAFSFHIDAPQVLLTSADGNANKAAKMAKPAAQQVERLIHDFYVQAYLAPAEWEDGAYASTFDAFSDGAKAEAMKQLDAMTAGTQAADTIDTIKAGDASLKEKVLMDPKGQPYSVVAEVTFTASADLKDGTSGGVTSEGQYIFEKTDSGWKITSFSVTRNDKAGTTTASSTPTGVAS